MDWNLVGLIITVIATATAIYSSYRLKKESQEFNEQMVIPLFNKLRMNCISLTGDTTLKRIKPKIMFTSISIEDLFVDVNFRSFSYIPVEQNDLEIRTLSMKSVIAMVLVLAGNAWRYEKHRMYPVIAEAFTKAVTLSLLSSIDKSTRYVEVQLIPFSPYTEYFQKLIVDKRLTEYRRRVLGIDSNNSLDIQKTQSKEILEVLCGRANISMETIDALKMDFSNWEDVIHTLRVVLDENRKMSENIIKMSETKTESVPAPNDDIQKPKAFISYVHENSNEVNRLENALKRSGIDVWRDITKLCPGARWKSEIRNAIREGDFFLACFSKEYAKKTRTYMNEELNVAVEELRLRKDNVWFIPVLLSECSIPELNIGRDQTLRDFHGVNLYDDWEKGVEQIIKAIIGIQD